MAMCKVGCRQGSWLLVVLVSAAVAPAWGCSDDGQVPDGSEADQAIRDLARDVPDEREPTDAISDGSTGDDATDAAIQDGAAGSDPVADVHSDAPGPDNLSVGCESHGECPASEEDPGVCCTEALFYRSYCSTLSVCGGGGRDACLTDDQCSARDTERPYCCHDPGWYHYCAPSRDTCVPLEPCESWQDCGVENRDCCSLHAYYLVPMCTTEFLAANPPADCPP